MISKIIIYIFALFSFLPVKAQEKHRNYFSEGKFVVSKDSVRIYGTLITPKKIKKKIPVALIIAGSGPTDRNGNSGALMVNNSLKFLAEGLLKKGVASLRYDKRGVGKSVSAFIKEKNLRFEDYIEDAVRLIELLKKDERFSKVIVIGHSEGSLIGMIAANKTEVDAFVSLAGAGRPADEILKQQLKGQFPQEKTNSIIDSLKSGHLVSELGPLSSLFRPSVQPYIISWFKYNPQLEIAELDMPILIVQGENDIQVGIEDAKLLAEANPRAQLKIISRMNHIFKNVEKDPVKNIKTYYNEKLPINKELLSSVLNFLRK
jgi:pimeloyl-ACP methyl ester carboxylesterase